MSVLKSKIKPCDQSLAPAGTTRYVGILIDPFSETINYHDIFYNEDSGFKKIQEAIECQTFTISRISPTEVMYLDDEGLLKRNNRYFAMHKNMNKDFTYKTALKNIIINKIHPFVRKALILNDLGTGDIESTEYKIQHWDENYGKDKVFRLSVCDDMEEFDEYDYGVGFLDKDFKLEPRMVFHTA